MARSVEQNEPELKECIAELVRTEYCAPNPIFNVRQIVETPVDSPDGPLQAFKLMLSDGKKMITALLVADMHWFVITEVVVGAYIMVDRYKFCNAKRTNKPGLIAYIKIVDFHVVGYKKGSNPHEVVPGVGAIEKAPPTLESSKRDGRGDASEDNQHRAKRTKHGNGSAEESKDTGAFELRLSASKTESGEFNKSGHGNSKIEIEKEPENVTRGESDKAAILRSTAAESSSVSRGLTAFPFHVYQRKIVGHWHRCHRLPFLQRQSSYSSAPAKLVTYREVEGPDTIGDLTDEIVNDLYPLACGSLSQYAIHEMEAGRALQRINTPLDVITLKSLGGLANRQGRICDILAYIEEISSEVVNGPLGPKREVKLSDPSTLKRVLLSVFVDPINFTPSVGTLCLFRNLRNHRWDGASLNAYRGDCEGRDWYIPNPEFAFPKAKIDWVRGWWDERSKRRRENYGCEVAESDDEYGWPAEKKPPRETVFGGSDSEDG